MQTKTIPLVALLRLARLERNSFSSTIAHVGPQTTMEKPHNLIICTCIIVNFSKIITIAQGIKLSLTQCLQPLQIITIMWQLQQLDEISSLGNNGILVQRWVRTEIMRLDLLHVHCFLHSLHLIDLAAIIQYGWTIRDRSSICLEIHYIYLVKAEQRHK